MNARVLIGLALLLVVLPASPAAAQQREVRVCVVRDGELATETRMYDPAIPDTAVSGPHPPASRPPMPGYAIREAFYVDREPITFDGRRYLHHGLPRVLEIGRVVRVGTYHGLGVYADAGTTGRPSVVYLPVRPGCEFQPYALEEKVAAGTASGRRFGHVPLAGAGLRAP
ncbi:MAG TPA: hypothetical protein VF746_29220 [Longimicrobium sp.]|jgi:hypothetical protein